MLTLTLTLTLSINPNPNPLPVRRSGPQSAFLPPAWPVRCFYGPQSSMSCIAFI